MSISNATAIRKVAREGYFSQTNQAIAEEVKRRFNLNVMSSQIIEVLGSHKERKNRGSLFEKQLVSSRGKGGHEMVDSTAPLPINPEWESVETDTSYYASICGTGEVIYVPKALVEAAENCFKGRTIENHLIFWHYIDSWPYSDNSPEDWKEINDKYFEEVISNQNSRGKIRKWLENKGFIKIKKFLRFDGNLVNHYIPGEEPLKYQTISNGQLTPYPLQYKRYWSRLSLNSYTANDPLCIATRENLSLLTKKNGEKPQYGGEKNRIKRKNRDLHSLHKLSTNSGNIKRGHRVSRLFSPWVTASKEVRKCFLIDGCGISSLDLKAAHPTLISQLSGDRQLREDCMSDVFYLGIASMLGVDRDMAKKAFMAYAYGRNRKHAGFNKPAYLVQEWMHKHYPVAAQYASSQKAEKHYVDFSCALQNLESKIFVEGIFQELVERNILALTVHDALHFRNQDKAEIEEISHKHLHKYLPDNKYKLEPEKISVITDCSPSAHHIPESITCKE